MNKPTSIYFKLKVDNADVEAWLVEYSGKSALYIPLSCLLLELTDSGVSDIKSFIDNERISPTIRDIFELIREKPIAESFDRSLEEYAPTVIGLGLTDICQLKCVYCHSDSGNESQCTSMPFEVAQKAILMAAENAKKLNRPLDVGFIGPGEQTTVWELFTKVICYIYDIAQEYGINTNLTLATNGCYGKEKRKFIVDRFDGVSPVSYTHLRAHET